MRGLHYCLLLVFALATVGCASQNTSEPASPPDQSPALCAVIPPEPVANKPVAGPPTIDEFLRELKGRLKDIEIDMAKASKEFQSRKKGHKKLTSEARTLQRQLAADKKKYQGRLARFEKLIVETKRLESLKAQLVAQRADLDRRHTEATQQMTAAEAQLAEAKAKYESAQRDSDSEASKVAKAKDEQAKRAAVVQSQIKKFNDQAREKREKIFALESEIRGSRVKIQEMEAQVTDSETEDHLATVRLSDAQVRLQEAKGKASARQAEMNQHQLIADQHMRDRESQEANLKLDMVKMDQSRQRKLASADPVPSLQMRHKADGSSMKVRHACRIYDRPNTHAKILGSKRAGSMVSGQSENNWMTFSLPSGATGFLAMSCFGT
jgi:hypothetical protein